MPLHLGTTSDGLLKWDGEPGELAGDTMPDVARTATYPVAKWNQEWTTELSGSSVWVFEVTIAIPAGERAILEFRLK